MENIEQPAQEGTDTRGFYEVPIAYHESEAVQIPVAVDVPLVRRPRFSAAMITPGFVHPLIYAYLGPDGSLLEE